MASLSRIYAFDVKPFHTHWYRWPGNLKHPFSLSVIPNGYNIEETCASCFMERVVHRRFAVHYVIFMTGDNTEKKVDIGGEKGAQMSVVARKIVTQWWSKIMIMKYKQALHDICFLFSRYFF